MGLFLQYYKFINNLTSLDYSQSTLVFLSLKYEIFTNFICLFYIINEKYFHLEFDQSGLNLDISTIG